MKTFIKANAASVIASFCDYLFTIILKELLNADTVVASICGTTAGGIINFFICRHWVFNAHNSSIHFQGKRYLAAWAGNLLLNSLGVYVLIKYAGLNYIIAKVITSVTVAVAYNYPLQKKYVFKNNQY